MRTKFEMGAGAVILENELRNEVALWKRRCQLADNVIFAAERMTGEPHLRAQEDYDAAVTAYFMFLDQFFDVLCPPEESA